jgi:FKBP-type peptidyl-prolyl cis-trans isomerase FkpA
MVLSGIQDALNGKTEDIDHEAYSPLAQSFAQTRSAEVLEREKVETKEFLSEAGKAKGAKTTESGLIYTELSAGNGTSPSPTDTVKVHYHGTLRDGTVFDSSVKRGQPAEFPLNRVIPCWTEAVSLMKPGGKSKLVCPPDIAYGDRGSPPVIPGGAALTFEVELIEVVSQ